MTKIDYLSNSKDFIGLSDEDKPTTNIGDGSTFYEVDTGKFYIYYKGEWYKQGEEQSVDFRLVDVNTQEELSDGDTIRVTDLGIDYSIVLYSDNEISSDLISCSSSNTSITTIEYIPVPEEDTICGVFMLHPDNNGNCTVTLTIGTKTFTFNIEVAIIG